MKTLPGEIHIDRAPGDLATPELTASYRAAWTLASFHPGHALAQQLANWLFRARKELQDRGEPEPEAACREGST
jgi:hypothetical protein